MDHAIQARALDIPTVVVGLGRFGTAVTKRLIDEREEALRLEGHPVEGDDIRGVTRDAKVDAEGIADEVMEEVRGLLAHDRLVRARDRANVDGLTRLRVFVVAHLGEALVRDRLLATVKAIEGRLLGELGPIFESFRTGVHRNGVILPLLAMPHPAGSDEGSDVIQAARAFTAAVARTPARQRAIPQVYLVEDVAEFSVLSDDELAQLIRNFVSLLVYAVEAFDESTNIIYGQQPQEPLATFVCSVAELPRARLQAYGKNRVALEVLDAIRSTPRQDATLSEADALEEVEARSFDLDDEAENDVMAVLDRYAPKVVRDPYPPWSERGEVLRERYGPDEGDPSNDLPAAPLDPPKGWIRDRMKKIEETWRLLQRKRFDDVVARDRAKIESMRDALLERLRTRIDRELWSDPAPASFRRTEELVNKLERAFRDQLDQSIADRDATTPAAPPSFAPLQAAHAHTLDCARRKPDFGRMLLWGGLALIATFLFLPAVLQWLAEALGMSPTRWFEPAFREYAWATALGVGLLGISGLLAHRLLTAHFALIRALDEMWVALENTVTGPTGSLLEYFATRLRLSRDIARVEALLAVRAALAADSERLLLIDKAARRASAALRDHQRKLGVTFSPDGDDVRGLLGREGESLIEPFVGEVGARQIVEALLEAGRDSRVRDVLRRLAEHYGRHDRWREEVPFASVERLLTATASHAEPIAKWDAFADAERSEATADHLAAFVRRQARSLKLALNFSGHESRDTSGMTMPFRGDGILPAAAFDLVERRLKDDGTHMPLKRGRDPDRAYYVVAVGDIDEASVASLTSGAPVVPPAVRFDPKPEGSG